MLRGGGQERGARAGTENAAGIAGFGAAAASAMATIEGDGERMRVLRDRLEAGLGTDSVVVFSRGVERLPNTSLFAVPGIRAETALINLDLDGIAVSSGSACSSGKVTPLPCPRRHGHRQGTRRRRRPGERRPDHQRK